MAFDSGQVSNGAQIHNFLRVGFAQHGKTGLTNGHNVAVVTEDVQGLGSNGTGGNVKTQGSCSAAILYMLGIISRRP